MSAPHFLCLSPLEYYDMMVLLHPDDPQWARLAAARNAEVWKGRLRSGNILRSPAHPLQWLAAQERR